MAIFPIFPLAIFLSFLGFLGPFLGKVFVFLPPVFSFSNMRALLEPSSESESDESLPLSFLSKSSPSSTSFVISISLEFLTLPSAIGLYYII